VAFSGEVITVKGPLGTITQAANPLVTVANDNGTLNFAPADESREANAMSGTMRALVANMVNWRYEGFRAQADAGWRWLSRAGAGRQAESVAGFLAPRGACDAGRRQS